MPYKERTAGKLYWTIGEVASELGVNTSSIRYWEKEFGTLNPRRNGKGDRLYTAKDLDQLRRIHGLVKVQGFTLNGAKARLTGGDGAEAPPMDVGELRERLLAVRRKLIELARPPGRE